MLIFLYVGNGIEEKEMIEGVEIKELKPIMDSRGYLVEILRKDDAIFSEFGQVMVSSLFPGVVKAWHWHHRQTDYFCVVQGSVKIVLYDPRKFSQTYKEIEEYFLSPLYTTHKLLKVPPYVYHGYQCLGVESCVILNIPSEPYNKEEPDEFRCSPSVYENDISYNWRKNIDG